MSNQGSRGRPITSRGGQSRGREVVLRPGKRAPGPDPYQLARSQLNSPSAVQQVARRTTFEEDEQDFQEFERNQQERFNQELQYVRQQGLARGRGRGKTQARPPQLDRGRGPLQLSNSQPQIQASQVVSNRGSANAAAPVSSSANRPELSRRTMLQTVTSSSSNMVYRPRSLAHEDPDRDVPVNEPTDGGEDDINEQSDGERAEPERPQISDAQEIDEYDNIDAEQAFEAELQNVRLPSNYSSAVQNQLAAADDDADEQGMEEEPDEALVTRQSQSVSKRQLSTSTDSSPSSGKAFQSKAARAVSPAATATRLNRLSLESPAGQQQAAAPVRLSSLPIQQSASNTNQEEENELRKESGKWLDTLKQATRNINMAIQATDGKGNPLPFTSQELRDIFRLSANVHSMYIVKYANQPRQSINDVDLDENIVQDPLAVVDYGYLFATARKGAITEYQRFQFAVVYGYYLLLEFITNAKSMMESGSGTFFFSKQFYAYHREDFQAFLAPAGITVPETLTFNFVIHLLLFLFPYDSPSHPEASFARMLKMISTPSTVFYPKFNIPG